MGELPSMLEESGAGRCAPNPEPCADGRWKGWGRAGEGLGKGWGRAGEGLGIPKSCQGKREGEPGNLQAEAGCSFSPEECGTPAYQSDKGLPGGIPGIWGVRCREGERKTPQRA